MRPLAHDETVWAREALHAGDTLAEIADACECDVLDVARALGVDRYRPPSMRWRQSVSGVGQRKSQWVGGLLVEVARARCAAGETPVDLAAEARVSRRQMMVVLRGLLRPDRCKRHHLDTFARAA